MDSSETLISYHYGSDGIFGFTYNGTEYYYGKNLFGDITDIYDASGVKVAHYAYDAWGNHTVYNGSGTPMYSLDFIGVINPFRYRGYYYDIESGRYYLNSRYYEPTKGRFLNADTLPYLGADGELRGYNLYTYCGNNPVMNVDPSGHFFIQNPNNTVAINILDHPKKTNVYTFSPHFLRGAEFYYFLLQFKNIL